MEISIVHQQQQAMSCHGLEELLIGCPNPPPPPPPEKKPRSQPEPALKCPRCSSTNTKFCYYNNYSLSQPRHFCKGCRRYWTKGGTLRNVPVGGGCRKNRRSSSSSSASYSHGDLTLAFARQLWPPLADHQQFFLQNPNPNPNPNPNGGFLDLMRNGTFLESSNSINGSVVQMPIGVDGAMAMEYSSLHALLNI